VNLKIKCLHTGFYLVVVIRNLLESQATEIYCSCHVAIGVVHSLTQYLELPYRHVICDQCADDDCCSVTNCSGGSWSRTPLGPNFLTPCGLVSRVMIPKDEIFTLLQNQMLEYRAACRHNWLYFPQPSAWHSLGPFIIHFLSSGIWSAGLGGKGTGINYVS
jgi:hypothetical protein